MQCLLQLESSRNYCKENKYKKKIYTACSLDRQKKKPCAYDVFDTSIDRRKCIQAASYKHFTYGVTPKNQLKLFKT